MTNDPWTGIETLPFGAKRRECIMQWIELHGKVFINRKYTLQMKKDKDLQYLLKRGKIKIHREFFNACRHTDPINKTSLKRQMHGTTYITKA